MCVFYRVFVNEQSKYKFFIFHWPQEQTIIVAHGPGEERTEPVKDLKKKKAIFFK